MISCHRSPWFLTVSPALRRKMLRGRRIPSKPQNRRVGPRDAAYWLPKGDRHLVTVDYHPSGRGMEAAGSE